MIFLNRAKKRSLEEADNLYRALKKNRIYNEDLISAADREKLIALEKRFVPALKSKNFEELEVLKTEATQMGNRLFPSRPNDVWRENIEVFVVAIVVALAVRSFFIQPFKIPTGSMEPTLNGVRVTTMESAPPNLFVRILQLPLLGRTYTTLESKNGGEITNMQNGSYNFRLFSFDFTDVTIGNETVRVWTTRVSLEYKFGVHIGNVYPPGVILRLRVDPGDQVLVNKVIYNLRPPKRGEVFVFKTTNIEGIEETLRDQGIEGSEYYIKRCVGVPGDTLSVDPPYLKINGSVIHQPPAFDRIYSLQNDYHGYTFGDSERAHFLKSPDDTYTVQPNNFWAMGDNSFNSLDSRYWGPVPRENVVGTGAFVYWPFGAHWGLIR